MFSKKFVFFFQISVIFRSFQAKTATGKCVAMPLSVKSFLISYRFENSMSSSSFVNGVLTLRYTQKIFSQRSRSLSFQTAWKTSLNQGRLCFSVWGLVFVCCISNKYPMQALIRLWTDILFLRLVEGCVQDLVQSVSKSKF